MAQVYGEVQKEILTSANGDKVKQMDMEFILGSMETAMKVNSKIVSSMEKESSISLMVIHTKETTNSVNLQGLDSTTGLQVVFSKELSRQD